MDFFGILFDMKNGKKIPYSKNYFDTLFAENLAGVTTLTGTLPLTFTTSETALRSWTIYGNNTPHIATSTAVLPLTFTTTEDKLRDWEIRGNDDNGTENLFAPPDSFFTISGVEFKYENSVITIKGTSTANISSAHASFKNKTFVLKAGEYTYSRNASRDAVPMLYNSATNISLVGFNDITKTFTLFEDTTVYIGFYAANNTAIDITMYIMLVKGSTAPDHYIPYQQGVGERTANIFDVNAEKEVAFSTTYKYTLRGLEAEQYYTCSTNFESADHSTASLYFGGSSSNANGVWASRPLTLTASSQGTIDIYVRFISYGAGAPNIYDDIVAGNIWVMVIKGTIAPSSYVPFGYQIPISVNGTPQTFYIGNAPLTEGQSISKTSTGVDIATTEGENTISTTLYNKPETAISYVDYLGVGEKSGNDWQIPLTISDGTNTTSVNVPIDAPLTEGQSVTDTQTINTFEGANTIDTSLTNKPQMTITYKGG